MGSYCLDHHSCFAASHVGLPGAKIANAISVLRITKGCGAQLYEFNQNIRTSRKSDTAVWSSTVADIRPLISDLRQLSSSPKRNNGSTQPTKNSPKTSSSITQECSKQVSPPSTPSNPSSPLDPFLHTSALSLPACSLEGRCV